MLLDLLLLSINILLMQILGTGGSQIGCTLIAVAQIELLIKTAQTDGPMTFGAEAKFMLNLSPGFIQGVGLLLVPLCPIDLFATLGSPAPKASQ
jgi:hypothetical protein